MLIPVFHVLMPGAHFPDPVRTVSDFRRMPQFPVFSVPYRFSLRFPDQTVRRSYSDILCTDGFPRLFSDLLRNLRSLSDLPPLWYLPAFFRETPPSALPCEQS